MGKRHSVQVKFVRRKSKARRSTRIQPTTKRHEGSNTVLSVLSPSHDLNLTTIPKKSLPRHREERRTFGDLSFINDDRPSPFKTHSHSRGPAFAEESNRMKPFMPWCIFLPLLFVLTTLLLTIAIYALVVFAVLTTPKVGETSTATTVTSMTATTTTAPPSTICATNSSARLYNNQYIYSPTSQIYAAGMFQNQFGIYRSYAYGNVTSAIWTASQTTTSQTAYLAMQTDQNLVVYVLSNNAPLWSSVTFNSHNTDQPCLKMLDSGNLIWTNTSGTILWQSNSVQPG